MERTRWFDRKFDFSSNENNFPSIIERLKGTPILLRHKLDNISAVHLTLKPDGKWSIQENLGHLIDLEPLWQGRLRDIMNDKEVLTPADLENKKTDLANHNEKDIDDLLESFLKVRSETLTSLSSLSTNDIRKSALHPRLKTPMRIIDLFLFVAEHDDHHLATISSLNKLLSSR